MGENAEPKSGRGFWGKILHVNLGNGSVEYETIPEEWYRDYLSGVGLAAKVLWDRLRPGADPLGPDNILGFTTGLLTDTGSLFSGRFMVVGKSPATGGWGDANCGGYFSPSLKRCGVDAIFIHGASAKPVYLYLDEKTAEIRDASDLWGRDTVETESILKEALGKRVQVACIGPSGEKLSYLAGISNDGGRFAARSGLGAVMGSKKLKAVVAAGRGRVGVADKARISELSKGFSQRLTKFAWAEKALGDGLLGLVGWTTRVLPVYMRQPADLFRLLLRKYGTSALTALSCESGDSPVKNWAGVGCRDFPLSRVQKTSAGAVAAYETKKYGCYSCPLKCGGMVKVEDGPHKIEEMHKPEYETICAFGAMLLNDDLHSIFKINDMVNRGGIDSISCGAVVSFAFECYEKGILTQEDTGGLELRWGDAQAIIRLTEMVINREGLGDILADGVKRAAEIIGRGSARLAVHCGGIEPPMHDPKFDPGQATAYYCEPTPGRHTVSSYTYLDLQLLEKKFKKAHKVPMLMTHWRRHTYDTGPALAVDTCFKMLMDGAGVCLFGTSVGGDMPLCEWLNAATGWNLEPDDYLVIGERIEQLRHAFNLREGLNPIRDFKPHPRIYGDPPQTVGPAKNVRIDMDAMARSFYDAFAWDVESGRPDPGRLAELGLGEVAAILSEGAESKPPLDGI